MRDILVPNWDCRRRTRDHIDPARIGFFGFSRGGYTVPALAGLLPQRPEFHVVANAAHFAFLAPCPEQLARDAPEICNDAKGFDRAALHESLDAKALAFFSANLR